MALHSQSSQNSYMAAEDYNSNCPKGNQIYKVFYNLVSNVTQIHFSWDVFVEITTKFLTGLMEGIYTSPDHEDSVKVCANVF